MVADVAEADLKSASSVCFLSLVSLGIPVITACVPTWANLLGDETHEAKSFLWPPLTSNQWLDLEEVIPVSS